MHPDRPKVANVDEYLALFEGVTKEKLVELRAIVREAAPEAEELISYSIPAYKYHGWLVYFSGGYKDHVSVSFPPKTIMQAFEKELAPYKSSKSTVQFPLSEPLPRVLIAKMVQYKVKENIQLEAGK